MKNLNKQFKKNCIQNIGNIFDINFVTSKLHNNFEIVPFFLKVGKLFRETEEKVNISNQQFQSVFTNKADQESSP